MPRVKAAKDRQRRRQGEGSLVWREDKKLYQIRVTIAPGVRKTLYAKTEDAAKQALRKALAAAESGEPIVDRRVTVEQFLREWLEGPAKRKLKPSTFAAYSHYVEAHLIPGLGKRKLYTLRPEHIDTFLQNATTIRKDKKEPLSPRTKVQIRAILRSALSWGERRGKVGRNVARLSEAPAVKRREIVPLTVEEARKLVEHAKGERLGALYVLALDTGLRQGELLGLRWVDVDLDAHTLRVVQARQRVNGSPIFDAPKSATSRRTVTFSETTAEFLKGWRSTQLEERLKAGKRWQDSGLVFTGSTGAPLEASSVTHAFQRFLARCGLPRQRFHDLRHATASFLLATGMPLKAVSERLGHSSISITADTYGHLSAELQQQAASHMQALLGATKTAQAN